LIQRSSSYIQRPLPPGLMWPKTKIKKTFYEYFFNLFPSSWFFELF
jgi:hypothetical protein